MAGPWLIVAIQTPDPTAGSCARRGHALSSRYWPRIVGSDITGPPILPVNLPRHLQFTPEVQIYCMKLSYILVWCKLNVL